MSNIAFYAGSFDPFTNGHLEIVKRASLLFDTIVIGIGINENKKRRFPKEKMKQAIEESLKKEKINNFKVVIYKGYTHQIAKENLSHILIRGLRNQTDYLYEEEIAKYNEQHNIDTIYMRAKEYGNISSSFVYNELLKDKDITKYVPEPVKNLILKK